MPRNRTTLTIRRWAAAPTMVLTLAVAACSSDDTTPASTADAGTPDTGAGDAQSAVDAGATSDAPSSGNCVPPGTPNNEKGVGGYCSPGGGECASDAAGFILCSGDVGAPVGSYFCTTPCSADDQCGTNAYCANDPRGRACVPNACGTPPDAGADAARD